MSKPIQPAVTDTPMHTAVAVVPERLESNELGQMAGATDDVWARVLAKVVPTCVVLKGALHESAATPAPSQHALCPVVFPVPMQQVPVGTRAC